MFSAGSPYSSFFMSGLLPSHSTSTANDDEDEYLYEVDFRRRGSLPDPSSPRASVAQFYKERSFLSLDLAGTGSLHTSSLHTLRSRPSLQSLPSQKPMPRYADELPALPTINPRASSSVLPPTSVAAANLKRDISIKTAVSTVSTNYRRSKRSDALARLEGRPQGPLASFKFGDIGEESTSNFISLSDDEDSSEDEWNMHSDEDADFVDLDIDFGSSHRYSYSTPSQLDDEEAVLPYSPRHTYSRSFFSAGSSSLSSRPRRRRSKRSNSTYGFSLSKPESPLHNRAKSMFPLDSSAKQYTSFIDLEHREPSSFSSDFLPKLKRLSISSKKDLLAPLLSPKSNQWSSFMEISTVA